MKCSKVLSFVAAAIVAVGVVGCSDPAASTGPSATPLHPQTGLLSGLGLTGGAGATAVRWNHEPSSVLTVTAVIGTGGGSLSIPGADFTITFPAGALSQATTLTVNTVQGPYVVYDMLPHGITFRTPVKVRQGLRNTLAYHDGLLGTGIGANVFGAYTASDAYPAPNGGFKATEILLSQTVWSLIGGLLQPDYQTWQINHFSRYMLASG